RGRSAPHHLPHVRFLPHARPPRRNAPRATPGQRAKWIRVAVANEPQLRLDDRELLRDGPSYTVDTLAGLRRDLPGRPLCLVMGRDVFAKLPEWHEWRQLFELAHIVLINRPEVDIELQPAARTELDARATDNIHDLHRRGAGLIYSHAPPPLAISSSRIRELFAAGRSPRFLLPDSVLADILDASVYQYPETAKQPS